MDVRTPTPKKKGPGLKVDCADPSENDSGGDSISSIVALSNMDMRDEDMKDEFEIGSGAGGTIYKSLHVPTNTYMARKAMIIKKEDREMAMKEIQFLKRCASPYIVVYHGAYIAGGEVSICLEFMDVGSIERLYKKIGSIPETVIGKVAESVINGLTYLYESHKIIHRDLKPSNMLINSKGQVKLCDFGVSGQAKNSVCFTYVGTSWYMSPMRIQGGQEYRTQSDSWSLGLSLLEMYIGRFPYFSTKDKPTSSVFDVISRIVRDPQPEPPADASKELQHLIRVCLNKSEDERPSPAQLSKHAFIVKSRATPFDLAAWLKKIMPQGPELKMGE